MTRYYPSPWKEAGKSIKSILGLGKATAPKRIGGKVKTVYPKKTKSKWTSEK